MNKYVFKPYNKRFPELFQKEKERIGAALKIEALIEHVGSTAVPGLGGKGIIDIAVAVNKEEMDEACSRLQEVGYEFRPTFSTSDRYYFVIDLPDFDEGVRCYHVHLTYSENKEWREFIGIRDYLRKHPEAIYEYEAIKKDAILCGAEGVEYRRRKEPLFEKIRRIIMDSKVSKSPISRLARG